MSKKIFEYILLLIMFNQISSQLLDKSVLKAAGCVTLVKKLKNKPNDKKMDTIFLLSCFINIDESTADQLLQNQYYEKIGIEENQIMELINFESIRKRYTEEQISEYSKAINKALEPLKNDGKKSKEEQDSFGYKYSMEDKESSEENNTNFIINIIIKYLTSTDSLILLCGLSIIFYFSLQKIRKFFSESDNDGNNINKNKKALRNKNNKKKKK